MHVLGVDLGMACGWSVLDAVTGARHASGCWDLKGTRHEGGGMRHIRMRSYLIQMRTAYPDLVAIAYEEVHRHLGTDAAHAYGGFRTTLLTFAEDWGIPYIGIPVATIKQAATGAGNASKEDVIAAANARWHLALNIDDEDDDEADALWIAASWITDYGTGLVAQPVVKKVAKATKKAPPPPPAPSKPLTVRKTPPPPPRR